MGVYAQTDITIECQDEKVAKKVAEKIKDKQKNDNEEYNNYEFKNLDIDNETIYLFKDSGRIQNLTYQCDVLWELIKDIEGVHKMHCPFLSEADGEYYSNVEDAIN